MNMLPLKKQINNKPKQKDIENALVIQVNRELINLKNNSDLGDLFRKCNFEILVRGRVHRAILRNQIKINQTENQKLILNKI